MAGYDPNTPAGLDAYWGNQQPGSPTFRDIMMMQSRQRGGRHNAAVDRIRAIKAAQAAHAQAVRDSLQNKILYANAIGRPDPSLIPMGELGKAGIEAQPGPQGLPYGIDPQSLTEDERAYLGLPPLAALYAGGGSGGGM